MHSFLASMVITKLTLYLIIGVINQTIHQQRVVADMAFRMLFECIEIIIQDHQHMAIHALNGDRLSTLYLRCIVNMPSFFPPNEELQDAQDEFIRMIVNGRRDEIVVIDGQYQKDLEWVCLSMLMHSMNSMHTWSESRLV
jgi:hypothetical protein